MWLPGHIAVGILLSSFALLLYASKRGSYIVPLAYAAFFAVLPDFFHFGDVRAFSHSFVGAAILLVVALSGLRLVHRWEPLLGLVATIALASHLLADTYIGSIHPWWPWSMATVQYHEFNSVFDIRAELDLCALALIPLIGLVLAWPKGLRMEGLARGDLQALTALLAPFCLFSLAQVVYYFDLDITANSTLSAQLLLMAFLAALLCSLVILVRSLWRLRKEYLIPIGNRIFTW